MTTPLPSAGGPTPPTHTGGGASSSSAGPLALGAVHYLQILYRRRYIALTAFTTVLVAALLYAVTATRVYQATTRILIERDEPNVVSFQEVLDQNALTDDYYETQYAILQGRSLARRTIDALDLWSHPLFNRPPRLTLRGVVMAPINVLVAQFAPPPVQPPGAAETFAQSRVIDQFLANLDVEAVRYSRLVDVGVRSVDPALAAKIVNTLASAYIQQTLELRSSTTKEASAFLTQQLGEQRAKLEASERALQDYRERINAVSLEERQNVVLQRLQELNAALTRANTARIQKEAAYQQVQSAVENPAVMDTVPAILLNPFVQQQKTQLADLQRQRAQLGDKLGPNHPDMVKLAVGIQGAEASIRGEIGQIVQSMRREYEAALAEERTLAAELNRQKQEAQELNRAGIQYGVLERDAVADRQMFESLLKRTQETGVSEELRTGNIRVVDEAEIPRAPVSPNIFNSLLLALLGGLTLAVGLVVGVEYIDDRIKNPDELKTHLGLPFLGMVPALFDRRITAPLITGGAASNFVESFRSLRTNVLFSSTADGGRMVVITSTAPGEGKTVVAANLSIALAQAGHRVLVIDADMRKPRIHELLRCRPAPGLSNLLVGNATASESIRESQTPGLWVMPAGTQPPNPPELLGSKRFQAFSQFVLQYFDWVIVDTPPVMAVTDAALAANIAHGVLFVVGSEMTSRRMAQRAVEQLELGQARFLGAVLNRVDVEHNAFYYSWYYRPEYYAYYGGPPNRESPQPAADNSKAGSTIGTVGEIVEPRAG